MQGKEKQTYSTGSKGSTNFDPFLLKKVFATFSVFYGTSWDSKLATDKLASITKHVWSLKLQSLTENEIDQGLDNLYGSFALNPAEFYDLCIKTKKVEYLGYANRIAFEKPRDKKAGRAAIANIRKIRGK